MIALVISCSAFVFAGTGNKVFELDVDSGANNNAVVSAFDNYTAQTEINNKSFNAGEFSLGLFLRDVEWLGVTDERTGTIRMKTGASNVDINKKLPNLRVISIANTIRRANLVGYSFDCSSLGTWDTSSGTGQWTVDYNTPETHIKKVLDKLSDPSNGYLKAKKVNLTRPEGEAPWMDSKIEIPKGTWFQYGNTVLKFTQKCTVNDLYDSRGVYDLYKVEKGSRTLVEERSRANLYASDFANFINKLDNDTEISTADDSRIEFFIPKGAVLQTAETNVTIYRDIDIVISSADIGNTDVLSAFADSIGNVQVISTDFVLINGAPYLEYSCDADKVFDGMFGVLNELIGVLAHSDVQIDLKCKHDSSTVVDVRDATVLEDGYTGDTVCAVCGEVLSKGESIPKLDPVIKLNYTSLKLQTGQSTSAVKVTYGSGDGIASVESDSSDIVTAAAAGTNGVKLTAGKTAGKAVVKVTLLSGITADISVTVQKTPVACTSLKITSGSSVSVKKGKTHQIKATRSPVTCVQKITYKTSNKKVATVSSSGKVKGVKKGTAKITVKCGSKSRTVKIKVK
jgi:hypothetical protein